MLIFKKKAAQVIAAAVKEKFGEGLISASELEGEFAEMMGVKVPDNAWLQGGDDVELLMSHPHDGVYALYLCAMIDNANQETALYANDMTVANEAIAAAKAWWRRHNAPPSNKRFKVM